MHLSQQLRFETAQLHNQIEQLPIIKKLMQPEVNINNYNSFLLKNYGYFFPLEKQISNLNPNLLEACLQLITFKSDYIYNDLCSLKIININQIHQTVCESIPKIQSFPQFAGMSYVLKGSELGNKILYKLMSTHFDTSSGFSYLKHSFSYPAGEWSRFIDIINNLSFDTLERDQAIQSAKSVFLTLHNWFKEPLLHEQTI